MSHDDHPSRDTLTRYDAGTLNGTVVGEVEHHLATCQHCMALLLTQISGRHKHPAPEPSTVAERPGGRGVPHEQLPHQGTDGPEATSLWPVDAAHYTVGEELARGGMGSIRLAHDRRLRRVVALKEILPHRGEMRRRFEHEAIITARLQHPGIVNVHEAGVWPGGAPFYAMSLVRGRPFSEAIKEATTLKQRLALLPNMLAIADAMAYAHGERVIHRDLKPGNVLVGVFGETVVIDWGLAKVLPESGSVREAPHHGPVEPASDPGMTMAGEVVGTPSYMSPEQGAGLQVDERADVYALGAILYKVLGGQAPYRAATSDLVLRALAEGPPAPLQSLAPDVPPELVTIVNKAMARRLSERYPTARELARDLREFQNGQLVGSHRYTYVQRVRRFVARNRVAVTVGLASLVLLLAVGSASVWRVFEARRLAETRRAEAERLLDFMLYELYAKLDPLGRLDLLSGVSEQASAYYRGNGRDSDEDLRRRGQVLENLSQVFSMQGNQQQVVEQCREALALRERLYARTQRVDDLFSVCSSRSQLGFELLTMGELDQAEAALHAVADQCATAAGATAPDSAARASQSRAHRTLSYLREARSDLAGARREAEQAIADLKPAEALAASAGDAQLELALGYDRLGDLTQAAGEPATAEKMFKAALAVRDRLLAHDENNARLLYALSRSQLGLGELATEQHDFPHAQQWLRAALAIRERLTNLDPSNLEYLKGLSLVHDRLATLLEGLGDTEAALTAAKAALLIDERVVNQSPKNSTARRNLPAAQLQVARLMVEHGDEAEAPDLFQRALEARQALAASDPANLELENLVAEVLWRLTTAQLWTGDLTSAESSARRTLALQEKLALQAPDDGALQDDLSEIQGQLGDVLLRKKQTAPAIEQYQKSLAIRARRAVGEGELGAQRWALIEAHAKLGTALTTTADLTGALDHFTQAQRALEALSEGDRGVSHREVEFAVADGLGSVLAARNDAAGAERELSRALSLAGAWSAQLPQATAPRHALALAHWHLGTLRAKARPAEGLKEHRAARALLESLAPARCHNQLWVEELRQLQLLTGP